MKSQLIVMLLGALCAPLFLGCQTMHLEKRTHSLRVETDPPGARLWYEDKSGQHPLGQSPAELRRDYQVNVYEFNPWWILWTLGSGAATAGGGVWIDKKGSESPHEGLAITLIVLGGLTFLVSATGLFSGLGYDGEEFHIGSEELLLGAQLDGYTSSNLRVRIPEAKGPVSMLLHPVGMAGGAANDLSVIVVQEAELDRVFPHQLPRYAQRGLGRIRLENRSTLPMDVELEFSVEGWAEPTLAKARLAPGSRQWVPVRAAFAEKLLENPEQRVVQALVEARFVRDDLKRSVRKSFPLTLMEGRAFSWAEPAGIASFVSGQDPLIETFAAGLFRQFAAAHPEQARASHPLRNHLLALFAFQSLGELGLRYKPDTERPFASLSRGAIDTVQFPSQTLERKVGDCDDLAVLYAAVLEAMGVPTALVPVTGHVFAMYDSGLRKENRGVFPVDAARTVERGGSLWVPVETTLLGQAKRFESAWMAGAESYMGKYKVAPEQVVEIRSAWLEHPPVALKPAGGKHSEVPVSLASADSQAMLKDYLARVRKLKGQNRGLAQAEALLEAGLFQDASAIFAQTLAKKNSYRGRYGLAVAMAGRGEMLKALLSFQQALKLAPDAQARFHCELAIAQCYKVDGNLPKARAHLSKALAINPASRYDARYRALFAYLEKDEGTKAAGAESTPRFFQEMLSGL